MKLRLSYADVLYQFQKISEIHVVITSLHVRSQSWT